MVQHAAIATQQTAFYARVTQDESIRRDLSLPNQRRRFLELAAREGWAYRCFIEQQAVSGELGVEDRAALKELVAAIAAGEVGRVVVRHLDRLGRGAVLEELIERLREHGVELWTFDGAQDIHSAAGRLGIRAQAMVGAFEVERGGERVREMKRQKARAGLYIGPAPFGFTSQARLKRELIAQYGEAETLRAQEEAQQTIAVSGRLYIDEAEAKLVREVYRLYLDERLGSRRIAQRLNRAGHRTRRGALWRGQQVLKIIRDPKLAGFVTYDEEAYEARRPSRAPVHQQTLYEGRHQAIIDVETWQRAQTKRKRSRNAKGGTQGGEKRVYALVGAVFCANGHQATSKGNGANTPAYYTCRRRRHIGTDEAVGGCDAPIIRMEQAEAAVREVLGRLLGQPEQLHEVLEAANRAGAKARPAEPERLREVKASLHGLDRNQERYYQMLENTEPGSPAEEVALERLVALRQRREALAAELQELQRLVIPLPRAIRLDQVREFVASIGERLSEDPAEFRELVQLLRSHHDLRVQLFDGRVRVSLAIDPDNLGEGTRVVATAAPRIPLSDEEVVEEELSLAAWVEFQNRKDRHCACGCGARLVIKPQHRCKGMPTYLAGHAPSAMEQLLDAVAADGLMTAQQARERLGVAETTFYRLVRRGMLEVAEERRVGRRTIQIFTPEAVERLREWRENTLDGPQMAEALGISYRRLVYLEKRGTLPEPSRDV